MYRCHIAVRPNARDIRSMQISRPGTLPERSDYDLITEHLSLKHSTLLELGCGNALTTRQLAEAYPDCEIFALEVDRTQHEKNLKAGALPNIRFGLGGAQSTGLNDGSVDAVIMLKSLHHVPVESMDRALTEIARVLRPHGLAYISEPVYAGDFNRILRRFHDEKIVREAAFAAIRRTVENGSFTLENEIHFLSESRFVGFEEFEQRIIGATHSEFSIDDQLLEEIRSAFMRFVDPDGIATFKNPMRVDLLRRPG